MATLTTPSKTATTTMLAWQDISNNTTIISAITSVATKFGGTAWVRIGRESGTALTAGWPNIRIEGSSKAAGNNTWIPIAVYQPQVGASIANTTLNGAAALGDPTIVVNSAANISAGDILFLSDSSASNYEIVRVRGVSGTTITLEEVLVNNHANSGLVTDQAEIVALSFDLTAHNRIRCVVDAASPGVAFAVEVLLTTQDNLSSV